MVIWLSATIVEILGQLNKCKITIFCGNRFFGNTEILLAGSDLTVQPLTTKTFSLSRKFSAKRLFSALEKLLIECTLRRRREKR